MNARELHEANFARQAYVLLTSNKYDFEVLKDEREKGISDGRKVTVKISNTSGFCKEYSFTPGYSHDAEFKNIVDDLTVDIKKNAIKDLDTFLNAFKKG